MAKQQTNILQWAVSIALIGLVLATFALVYQGQEQTQQRDTISVNGEFELEMAPDQATVQIGIQNTANSAKQAEEMTSQTMQDIKQALLQAGIPERDMETAQYSLQPVYDWEEVCIDRGPCKGERVFKGYKASNTLKITTPQTGKIGQVIDVAVQNGANNINSIQFELTRATEAEARKLALKEASIRARSKALAIAEGIAADLGKVVSASENFGYTPYYRSFGMEEVAAVKAGATPPIMPGEVTVRAQVNIAYEIE